MFVALRHTNGTDTIPHELDYFDFSPYPSQDDPPSQSHEQDCRPRSAAEYRYGSGIISGIISVSAYGIRYRGSRSPDPDSRDSKGEEEAAD